MNERVKKIREHFNKSQVEFAKSLGLSRSNIASIESGAVNLIDRNIKKICSEYPVDENWLRTGVGTMERDLSEDEEFDILVGKFLAENDPYKKKIIRTMLSLSEDDWELAKKLFSKFA